MGYRKRVGQQPTLDDDSFSPILHTVQWRLGCWTGIRESEGNVGTLYLTLT